MALVVMEGTRASRVTASPDLYASFRALSAVVGVGTSGRMIGHDRGAAWDVAEADLEELADRMRARLQVTVTPPVRDPRFVGSLLLLSALVFEQVGEQLSALAGQLPPGACSSGVASAVDGLNWATESTAPPARVRLTLDQVVDGDGEALVAAAADRLGELAPMGLTLLGGSRSGVDLLAPRSPLALAPLVNLWAQSLGEVARSPFGALRFTARYLDQHPD